MNHAKVAAKATRRDPGGRESVKMTADAPSERERLTVALERARASLDNTRRLRTAAGAEYERLRAQESVAAHAIVDIQRQLVSMGTDPSE